MEKQPDAWQDLARLGVVAVPLVTYGDKFVHGWNPKGVTELFGREYVEPERLTVAQLQERQRKILKAVQRALRQVPLDQLDVKAPHRDRTLRQLGFHIFRLSAAYIDTYVEDGLRYEWFAEEAPPSMVTGADIAAYGETVIQRLAEWFEKEPASVYDGFVKTYYGPQGGFDFLERTVWHAAQHARQIYLFSEWTGVQFDDPLTDEDYQGLPLPESLW